jgi:uncharacterized membrane protein YbhN (UPF0104 family)
MSSRTRRFLTTSVLLALLGMISLFLQAHPELLASIKNLTLFNSAWLISVRLAIFATNGLFLRAFARKFGIPLTFREWFGLAAITTMGNYITPFSGGLFVRATYLKKRHNMPYAQFTSLLASNYLIMFWVIGIMGFFFLCLIGQSWSMHWPIALLFVIIVIAISLIFVFPEQHIPWHNSIGRFLNTMLKSWYTVKQDYSLLSRMLLLTLITIGLNGISFWLAYWALGLQISLFVAFLLGMIAAFSIFINLTPGSLGIQEAMVSLSAALLGADAREALLVVLLIRAVTVFCAFILGPLYGYLLTRRSLTS